MGTGLEVEFKSYERRQGEPLLKLVGDALDPVARVYSVDDLVADLDPESAPDCLHEQWKLTGQTTRETLSEKLRT